MPVLILAYTDNIYHPLASALYLKRLLPQAELYTAIDDATAQKEWPTHIASFLHKLNQP